MKIRYLPILFLLAAAAVLAEDAPADVGLTAIEALGRINGQALACGEQAIAARAKQVMLKYAPRTPRYGSAFEQATQRGYMDQVKGQACPADAALATRTEAVVAELAAKLPATE
jgi:hypothetical protein